MRRVAFSGGGGAAHATGVSTARDAAGFGHTVCVVHCMFYTCYIYVCVFLSFNVEYFPGVFFVLYIYIYMYF